MEEHTHGAREEVTLTSTTSVATFCSAVYNYLVIKNTWKMNYFKLFKIKNNSTWCSIHLVYCGLLKKRLFLMLCHGDNLRLIGLHIPNTCLQDEAWQLWGEDTCKSHRKVIGFNGKKCWEFPLPCFTKTTQKVDVIHTRKSVYLIV